jgi:DNA anti-recombination protein RmuC
VRTSTDRLGTRPKVSFEQRRRKASDVAFQNFEEVWTAFGRLYDDIVKVQESQQQTAAQLARVTERIDRLAEAQERTMSMVATVAGTVAQLATVVESHERRLARMEGQ